VLDDLLGRLDALDAKFDEITVTPALDALLTHGHGALRHQRTDPLIGLLGAQLVDLVAAPMLGAPGRAAHPSSHRRRDRRRDECESCFDEGYALGRILLDTDRLALLHSPLSTLDGADLRAPTRSSARAAREAIGADDEARAAGYARLRALRRLVLREDTSDAFLRTTKLALFVRVRAGQRPRAGDGDVIETAPIEPALAAQLIGLGTMTALCEWSMVLGDDTPSAEVLRLR
jgi:hypothetical protein